jgi:hypothetical protein
MTSSTGVRLLVDADVLIKLSVLDCFSESIQALGYSLGDCATLKSMTFSAGLNSKAVRERKAGAGAPAQRLLKTLKSIPTLDKISKDERDLAAEIGRASQLHGLAVDGGEAILMSLSVHRGLPYITTGDKKAIRSLPVLCAHVSPVSQLKGKLMPLEYVLLRMVRQVGFAALATRLAAGAGCDTAVRKILAGAGKNQGLFEAGLEAKLATLRQQAPGFIAR